MSNIVVVVKEGNPAKPKSWRISLPANVAMKDLLNAMIQKLELPVQQRNGRQIVYKMHHVQSGNTLSDDDTLKGAGVADKDIIELQVRSPRSVAPKTITVVRVIEEECTGCGVCVDECPVEAISMNDDYIAVIDQDECTECGACVETCPSEAIVMED